MHLPSADKTGPVVLLPGFWHGTWSWVFVAEQLSARKVPSVAVDLPGQGLEGSPPRSLWRRPFDAAAFDAEDSKVASVTATSAASAVIERLATIGGGAPVTVVAHSMGGVVATLAAERAPELFSHLVYVAAVTPVSGVPAGAYIGSEENAGEEATALLRGDPFAIGASRLDVGDETIHHRLRSALHGDVPHELSDAALALLGVDAPVGIAAEAFRVSRERFGSVRRTYVTCSQDRMIRPRLQQRLVREMDEIAQTPTVVAPLVSSHSPFLSQPSALAEVIATAWQYRGTD